MWNAEFKLHLYPVQVSYHHQKINGLEKLLDTLGFTGERISSQSINRYKVGDKFLSYLTFMGCSPDIELEPQDEKPYCYIEIEQTEEPRYIAGINLKPAKCPHCKSTIKQVTCLNCRKTIDHEKLNWRKTAFYASCWITVGNIYELEAIPNDNLLITLEKETGVKWKVAYIRYEQESS